MRDHYDIGPMPKGKVSAFFEEFPFLDRYADRTSTEVVEVRRWDADFIDTYPWMGSKGYWSLTIRLLDQRFETVAVVGEYPPTVRQWWNPLSWRGTSRKQEAAFDTVEKLGARAADVKMAVIVHNFYGQPRVTIYKPAKGHDNLKSWFEAYKAAYRSQPAA